MVEAAEAIGGEVLRITGILAEAFSAEAVIIKALNTRSKPNDMEALQQVLSPLSQVLVVASQLSTGPRSPYLNHYKVVAEASQALSWVAYTGPECGLSCPPQHVEEALNATEFYANKVLAEWRSKEPKTVDWILTMKGTLSELKAFCKRFYPNGPTWHSQALQKSAPPPPPPPPPPGSLALEQPKPSQANNGMAALFADLNRGEGITSGLKKVTAGMKTKNRPKESDATGVMHSISSVPTIPPAAKAPQARQAQQKAARIECQQGRKWVVEFQNGNKEILIENTEPRQSVYIFNCTNSTIHIRGKVNSIAMDSCAGTGLLFHSVISGVEVVNSTKVQMQCTGTVPTVAVDKTDGCQLFLSKETLEITEINTAKSSEVNVIMPGASEDDDSIEQAIPEQFVSKYANGHWATHAVSHGAG